MIKGDPEGSLQTKLKLERKDTGRYRDSRCFEDTNDADTSTSSRHHNNKKDEYEDDNTSNVIIPPNNTLEIKGTKKYIATDEKRTSKHKRGESSKKLKSVITHNTHPSRIETPVHVGSKSIITPLVTTTSTTAIVAPKKEYQQYSNGYNKVNNLKPLAGSYRFQASNSNKKTDLTIQARSSKYKNHAQKVVSSTNSRYSVDLNSKSGISKPTQLKYGDHATGTSQYPLYSGGREMKGRNNNANIKARNTTWRSDKENASGYHKKTTKYLESGNYLNKDGNLLSENARNFNNKSASTPNERINQTGKKKLKGNIKDKEGVSPLIPQYIRLNSSPPLNVLLEDVLTSKGNVVQTNKGNIEPMLEQSASKSTDTDNKYTFIKVFNQNDNFDNLDLSLVHLSSLSGIQKSGSESYNQAKLQNTEGLGKANENSIPQIKVSNGDTNGTLQQMYTKNLLNEDNDIELYHAIDGKLNSLDTPIIRTSDCDSVTNASSRNDFKKKYLSTTDRISNEEKTELCDKSSKYDDVLSRIVACGAGPGKNLTNTAINLNQSKKVGKNENTGSSFKLNEVFANPIKSNLNFHKLKSDNSVCRNDTRLKMTTKAISSGENIPYYDLNNFSNIEMQRKFYNDRVNPRKATWLFFVIALGKPEIVLKEVKNSFADGTSDSRNNTRSISLSPYKLNFKLLFVYHIKNNNYFNLTLSSLETKLFWRSKLAQESYLIGIGNVLETELGSTSQREISSVVKVKYKFSEENKEMIREIYSMCYGDDMDVEERDPTNENRQIDFDYSHTVEFKSVIGARIQESKRHKVKLDCPFNVSNICVFKVTLF
ncbi:hypothetical protein AX774_g1945 [Zancudomyces culisetae]|uniref:Uncharacterized protein n=1 Tax=Zancudomyces culisetae TaxID=1213189 RepID=A0A1R1PU92_ZANCU|nr:hypothetical protein AX774_g1945 [Zancudomyces culisetae]|eukprot:OMH84540.1 hypothetical protein AX774_g1945 [Zancudomyces culisetae]